MPSPPKQRPTIFDVAREAKVSITTVSLVLNGKGLVGQDTRDRVKGCASALGYVPNVRAQRLRSRKAQTIALISSMPLNISGGESRLGFLMEIAAVAASVALTKGLALMLIPPYESSRLPLERLDIDGAIVVEPAAGDEQVIQLQNMGIPVVSLGRQAGLDSVPFIDLHSTAAAQLLFRHLFAQGAVHIALLIGASERSSYIETEAAYRNFCQEHGMAPIVSKAIEAGGDGAGYLAAKQLLLEHPEIDGICAIAEAFAVGAVLAAKELGRNIPGDLKIVTRYDGFRIRNCKPPLTAVDLHLEDVAALAIHALLDIFEGIPNPNQILPPLPKLIPRYSSSNS